MFEYQAEHFRELCATDPVRSEIGTLEQRRRRLVRRFWLMLGGTLLVLAAVVAVAIVSNSPKLGFVFSILVFGLGLGSALQPLADAKDDLKQIVLETAARIGGMEYVAGGFEPPVLGTARHALFGDGRWGFGDLFHGTDARGKRFAVYEALLSRGPPKHRRTLFDGQVFAWQREAKGEGETAILPDKGLLNLFAAPAGMERVKFHGADEEFEWEYQVHSTAPASAPALVGSELRRLLLELRRNGKVFAYIGPEDALVAVSGEDRFEPGSMFRARSGEQRAKRMFDDVCASMALLRRLRAAIG